MSHLDGGQVGIRYIYIYFVFAAYHLILKATPFYQGRLRLNPMIPKQGDLAEKLDILKTFILGVHAFILTQSVTLLEMTPFAWIQSGCWGFLWGFARGLLLYPWCQDKIRDDMPWQGHRVHFLRSEPWSRPRCLSPYAGWELYIQRWSHFSNKHWTWLSLGLQCFH